MWKKAPQVGDASLLGYEKKTNAHDFKLFEQTTGQSYVVPRKAFCRVSRWWIGIIPRSVSKIRPLTIGEPLSRSQRASLIVFAFVRPLRDWLSVWVYWDWFSGYGLVGCSFSVDQDWLLFRCIGIGAMHWLDVKFVLIRIGSSSTDA